MKRKIVLIAFVLFWLCGGNVAYRMGKEHKKSMGRGDWTYKDAFIAGFCCYGAGWFMVGALYIEYNHLLQKPSPF